MADNGYDSAVKRPVARDRGAFRVFRSDGTRRRSRRPSPRHSIADDDGIIVSNGPCWSPDDRTFYFTDSWSGEISAYDYEIETGAVSNRRTFAKVDTSRGGASDGSTVDAEGFVWNAQVYDGKLVRYAPDGTVDRVVDMPVKKVTSVNFGGPDLDILFVTSMAKPPLPRFPGDGQRRGAVFAVTELGVRGLPEPRFGA